MFAIALWDRAERRLYLSRDRFGEKPLYYGWTRDRFVFGSELKALCCLPSFDNPVDRDVLGLYMRFSYVPAPYAIYRNVYKLEPGCVASLTLADASSPPASALFAPDRYGTFSLDRYWSLPEVVGRGLADPILDERQAIDELEQALSTAVSGQSIADVPLGAFLSGGIDSSTVAALMQAQSARSIKTFTIGFENAAFDEAPYARAVANHLGTDHTELYVSSEQTQEVIPLLPDLYSEPFADSSQIPTYLVSRLARQQVTVALSGDGGDELFGGYNRYLWGKRIWNKVSWMPRGGRHLLGALTQSLSTDVLDRLGKCLPARMGTSRFGAKAHRLADRLKSVDNLDQLYNSLVTCWPSDSGVVLGARTRPTLLDDVTITRRVREPEYRMMILDALTYLPDDILQKVDRAAMGVSLETRTPFLDHRVAALASRVPLDMKIRGTQGKWLLRQVLDRHVPRELVDRPKAGFGMPVGPWLRGPLREWSEDLLSEPLLEAGGLNPEPIRKKWKQHLTGTHDWIAELWAVLMFQGWLRSTQ
jgi:asparagine synthase (glutamine-hydrolysing)